MTSQQQLVDALPEDLKDRALDLRPHGVAEFAFPLQEATRVLDVIDGRDWVLLGGDVWERTSGGPRPTGDSWYVQQRAGESDAELRDRARDTVRDFVTRLHATSESLLTFVLR